MHTEPVPTTNGRSSSGGVPTIAFIGAGLIALGVVLLLGQLDVIDAGEVLRRSWPVIILALGLYWLWRGPRIGGVVAIIIGGLWLVDANDLVPVDAGKFVWPVVLIVIGVAVVAAAVRARRNNVNLAGPTPVAVFDTRRWSGPMDEYAGAKLTTIFGDANLRLTSGEVSDNATLGVTTIFGDVNVSVPAGWRIRDEVTSIFGSVRTPQGQPDWPEAPLLTVHGFTLFGDVDLRYED